MRKELTMLIVFIALSALTTILGADFGNVSSAVDVVKAILGSNFLGAENLQNNLRHISLISLFAIGQAIVIIAGGIDLSVGSIICVTTVLTGSLVMHHDFGLVAAVACALAASLAIGVTQGAVIARMGVAPFVVTLGAMLLLRGIAEVLTGGTDIGFQGKYPGFRFLGEGVGLGMPMPFWFALAAILVTGFVMSRTLFGRYCYAVGSNPEAAHLSGVPVRSVQHATYIVSALLSGVAGLLYLAYLPTATPSVGAAYELHAIAAAVLGGVSLRGGRGTVFGVLIGAGIMQVTFNAVNLVGKSLWQNVVAGGVILAAVIFDRLMERK